MAKKNIYYTATGKTPIFSTKVDTAKYGTTLLDKMGFKTTEPTGTNNLIITASFEQMVEMFGFLGVKVQLEASGTIREALHPSPGLTILSASRMTLKRSKRSLWVHLKHGDKCCYPQLVVAG